MAARKRDGSGTGEAVGFGVAQANAYFNARRMGRRAPTKSKASATAREAEADQEECEEKLVLPPPSALRAILRSVDERDAKRQRVKYQEPSMQVTQCVSC